MLKKLLGYNMDIQEFRLYQVIKGYRYIGIKKSNYTYQDVGKHYCSIGAWWFEIKCFNAMKK